MFVECWQTSALEMEFQREGGRRLKEVSECSKADNEHRHLCCQSVRPISILTVLSADTFLSYDLNSSSIDSNRIVSDVAEDVHDLQEKMMMMQMELEDVRAAQLPVAPRLTDIESAALRTDYKFALRHFLDDARSEGTITPSPSMQVSSLCDSNSIVVSTLYHTALTHFDGPTDLSSARTGFGAELARMTESLWRSISLTIHDAPGFTPLNFTVSRYYCVGQVKKLVAGRLQLLNQDPQEFRLRCEGRILHDSRSLESYGIYHRVFLDYEAMGPQFQRFTHMPDGQPLTDTGETTRITSISESKSMVVS